MTFSTPIFPLEFTHQVNERLDEDRRRAQDTRQWIKDVRQARQERNRIKKMKMNKIKEASSGGFTVVRGPVPTKNVVSYTDEFIGISDPDIPVESFIGKINPTSKKIKKSRSPIPEDPNNLYSRSDILVREKVGPYTVCDMPYFSPQAHYNCPLARIDFPWEFKELRSALLAEYGRKDFARLVYLCKTRTYETLSCASNKTVEDYIWYDFFQRCKFSNPFGKIDHKDTHSYIGKNIENTGAAFAPRFKLEKLVAQSSCCKFNCIGQCRVIRNRIERQERMASAEAKRKALALKAEKQRILRELEKNKRSRDRAHAAWIKRNGVAQALDTLYQSISDTVQLPTSANNLLTKSGTLVETMTDSIDSVKEMLDKVVNYISNVADAFNIPKYVDLVSAGVSIYSIYKSVVLRDYLGLTLHLVNLSRNLRFDYNVWFNYMKQCLGVSQTESEAQSFEVLAPASVLGGFLVTLATMACGGKQTTYAYAVTHLADFGRAAMGWTKVTELFVWFKNMFLDVYYRCTLGKTLEELRLEEAYPLLETILARVHFVKNETQIGKYIDRDEKVCKRLIELDDDMTDVRYAALRAKDTGLSTHISSLQAQLKDVFLNARSSAAYSNKQRAAPTTLFIFGKSNVGKSNFVKYMKAAIYKEKYLDDPTWNVNTICHTRDVMNEFWDGYMDGQPILEYDDMLQTKDSVNKPNVEILEFIRVKNDAPYHLHMSDVKDKKNCYFSSPYVIATCNQKTPDTASIVAPDAFLRRWDLAVEVTVNPIWGKPSLDGTYTVLDLDKIAKNSTTGFQKDVYRINIYNIKTGNDIKVGMTLDEFMTLFWETTNKNLETSQTLAQSINEQLGLDLNAPGLVKDFAAKYDAVTSETGHHRPNGYLAQSDDHSPSLEHISLEPTNDPLALFIEDVKYAKDHYSTPKEIITDAFHDAKDAVESAADYFATPVKKAAAASATYVKDWYDKCMNAKIVTSFKGYVKNKLEVVSTNVCNFGSWLFSFFKSSHFKNVLTLLGVSTILGASLFLFVKKLSCNFVCATDIEILKVTTCGCMFCAKFVSTSKLGTYKYAIDALLFLISNDDDVYRQGHITRLSQAITKLEDETIDSAFSKFQKHSKYFSESKEAQISTPRHKLLAESKETQVKVNPFQIRAESHIPIFDSHNGILKAQSSDKVQLEQWESVALKNSVCLSDSMGGTTNGVFIRGTQILVPNHFVRQVLSKNGCFYLQALNFSDPQEFRMSNCDYHQCTDAAGNLVDLAILTLPNTTPQRPSILTKVTTANQLALVPEGRVVVSGIRKMNNQLMLINHHTQEVDVIERSLEYTSNYGPCRINAGIRYDVDTKVGDCGALVYAKNANIAGKIVGFHIAGCNGNGIAIPISSEFLYRNLNKIQALPRQTTDARIPFSAESKLADVKLENSIPVKSLALLGNCIALGTLPKLHSSKQSQIIQSNVCGVLQKPIMKPANLTPILINGEKVDPMIKGIKKIMNTSQPLDPQILNTVMADVAHLHQGGNIDKKVLSFEEAVVGLEDDPLYAPLNRSTSAGYPYNIGLKEPGKRAYFGYDEYTFSEEIRQDVTTLIDQARNNTRGDVVWGATLKDERRLIEKVDQGKTRVFTAGPQHYTIAFRQYFLGFIAHIARNKIDNEIGVGTNVYSLDWHKTALKLQNKGKHVIAGDFSNYDGSLLAEVMWKILDMINEWYDDGPENAQIRTVLFQDICHARILVGDELIQSDHSQPSGNPGTVVFNSLFNQIIMRYSYLLCKRKANLPLMCDFTEQVSMQTYGDDNVLNISHDVIAWYNQLTISEALATIGMTYTDEAKSGQMVESRTLDEIAYLKRKFVLSADGFYQAPLDITVCREMPNWIKNKNGTSKAATFTNCLAAIREFFFHGEEIYNDAHQKLSKALRHHVKERLPTYQEMQEFYDAGLYE